MTRVPRWRGCAAESLDDGIHGVTDEGWGLQDDTAPDCPSAQREDCGQCNERSKQRGRRACACHGSDESHGTHGKRDHDRAAKRHGAALPCRARRAQIGKGDDHEGERIDRHADPVEELGAKLSRCPLVDRVVWPRPKQFRERALLHGKLDIRCPGRQPRQIERVLHEAHDHRVTLFGLLPVHRAAFEHEKEAALVAQEIAAFGEDGDAFLRVALIVE